MRLLFIIGYDSAAIPLLREVLHEEAKEHGFEFRVMRDEECDAYIDELKKSDAVFVYSRKLPEEVAEVLKNPTARIVISVHSEYPSRIGYDSYLKARDLWLIAGRENFSALVHLILKELGFEVEVPEVKSVPWHGIYHPDLGIFEELEDYLKIYEKRPLVVTGCRETQIELGLHVFGSSDRERAVEYAATAMAKDSHYSVSLRRVIAEYLGLDYDKLREKPFEINGLGMTNLETVEFLQKTALGVLQRLVEMGIRSEDLDSAFLGGDGF
jgi:cobalamin biosynthesis Mg chelatase CobN